MKLVYLVISLLPPVAVVALAWYVVRAISVRVTWREIGRAPTGRRAGLRDARGSRLYCAACPPPACPARVCPSGGPGSGPCSRGRPRKSLAA